MDKNKPRLYHRQNLQKKTSFSDWRHQCYFPNELLILKDKDMDENKDRTKTKIETENKDINKKMDKNKTRQYQRQNLQIKLLFPPGNHRETSNAKVLEASWHWWLVKEVGAPLAHRRLLTFYRIGLDGT